MSGNVHGMCDAFFFQNQRDNFLDQSVCPFAGSAFGQLDVGEERALVFARDKAGLADMKQRDDTGNDKGEDQSDNADLAAGDADDAGVAVARLVNGAREPEQRTVLERFQRPQHGGAQRRRQRQGV